MIVETLATAVSASAGLLAYAVRGRSATILAPSVWRGPRTRTAVALTFDDGPSESTPEILEILAHHRVRATFFQCGSNVRRLPELACAVRDAGHEIGNHTESHASLYLRSSQFVKREVTAGQNSIEQVTGLRPKYFRAPFGARWFGLRGAQRELGLKGVMWTCNALDWRLSTERIVTRITSNVYSGSIILLHDGRQTQAKPNVRPTIEALREVIPAILERGFEFVTISELLCPNPSPTA
jgi:peptidoglycan-N-acetylglucosamine deacetylase